MSDIGLDPGAENNNNIRNIIGTIDEVVIWTIDKIKYWADVKFPEFASYTVVL